MTDIFEAFLASQLDELTRLCEGGSRLRLIAAEHTRANASQTGRAPDAYLLAFRCRTAVLDQRERVVVRDVECMFSIRLPADYLRRPSPDSAGILTWMTPGQIVHPNIRKPFVCVGPIAPGTPVVELVLRVWELAAYHRYLAREDDALSAFGCRWARRHMAEFPLDNRSLRSTGAARTGTATFRLMPETDA